jgi:hypothetical protein
MFIAHPEKLILGTFISAVIRHSEYNTTYAINTNIGYNSRLEAETTITKNYETRPRILVCSCQKD